MVKSVRDKDWCEEIHLPEKFNLKQFIEKLKKEKGGLARYIGDRKTIWDMEKIPTIYHAFRVDYDMEKWGMKASVIYLFDRETYELRFVELVKPFFLVLEI